MPAGERAGKVGANGRCFRLADAVGYWDGGAGAA